MKFTASLLEDLNNVLDAFEIPGMKCPVLERFPGFGRCWRARVNEHFVQQRWLSRAYPCVQLCCIARVAHNAEDMSLLIGTSRTNWIVCADDFFEWRTKYNSNDDALT